MVTRRAVLAAIACGLSCTRGLAQPPAFPTGPVRIVVPFPPGGATDLLARVLSKNLQALWGQAVAPENVPGASGLLGTRQVYAAPADGHILLLASTGAILALASSQGASGKYRIARDLAPVSLIAAPPYLLVVHPDMPARSAAELLAYAKRNPDKLSYGSSGTGSASHLSGALFRHMGGVRLQHVAYRGTALAVADLLAERIQMMFAPSQVVMPYIAAGRLRVLGTTGAQRSDLFPGYPTIAESGLAGYQSLGWFGLFAPAGTPRPLVLRISAAVSKVLTRPEVRARLVESGAEPAPNAPDEFGEFVDRDIKTWMGLAQRIGVNLSP